MIRLLIDRVTELLRRSAAVFGPGGPTSQSEEDLRAAFSTRYHGFKLLITANNRAHEIRTELEMALQGGRPFDMSFVRSRLTAISVNVFRVIKHLDELAPGKYVELYDRFKSIQAAVNEILSPHRQVHEGPLVVPLGSVDITVSDQVGSKMASVGELKNKIGLPVPKGFVITARACREFFRSNDLDAEIARRIQSTDSEKPDDLSKLSSDIQQLIITAPVPEDLERAVIEAYREIEKHTGIGVKVSIRSSALGEDVEGRAFAGQFRSKLNLSEESLIDGYKDVVASKYSLPAITYRLNMGIPDEDVVMCVGCMAMVDAASGGVMYSSNPIDIRDHSVFVNSVWGLPKAVVDGSVDPDVIVVSPGEPMKITHKEIKVKEQEYICYPEEGVCRMETPAEGKAGLQSTSDDKCLELARMAVKLAEYYGSPQDIEWAVTHDGSIYILQCRPLAQSDENARREEAVENLEPIAGVIARGGVTGSRGTASGPAFIVRSDVDKLRFPEGAILFAAQALPAWASLLGRAAAVVTEVGGVAGHLANVAREFGVPALFGLAGITGIVKDGDLVTVDADGLTVYQGRVDLLLSETASRKNLLMGSPVYEYLSRAAVHVVPLNLLDPDSPGFKPRNCRTLHDITRFAHEKSVQEMFSFGRDHKFSTVGSKQLWFNGPMQWWIINLDDGFAGPAEGKYVRLDNIVSIPMLALWEGATAIQWEGPPPVDSRGLVSILVQATSDPGLDPAMSSPYAVRNYFMISKHFCSLTSRFGFHFSTVEALVSERITENYASFSFKGGAADRNRRVRRVTFIRDILENCGFRVEITDDSLFARTDARDQGYMESRLKILGYLMIHTRQLDMVMSKPKEIERYRSKFLKDIELVVGCN